MMLCMEKPYVERTSEHFCSHMHAPDSGELAGAAMTCGKDGIYIPADVFSEYVKQGILLPKHLVFTAIEVKLFTHKVLFV
jgi:hypothetical protein